MTPPGDARDDVQILMEVAAELGATMPWSTAAGIRTALARALAHLPAYAGVDAVTFARPVAARTWLQSSNPSERWKWDHMFQDNPPVKGEPMLLRGALERLIGDRS